MFTYIYCIYTASICLINIILGEERKKKNQFEIVFALIYINWPITITSRIRIFFLVLLLLFVSFFFFFLKTVGMIYKIGQHCYDYFDTSFFNGLSTIYSILIIIVIYILLRCSKIVKNTWMNISIKISLSPFQISLDIVDLKIFVKFFGLVSINLYII